MDHQFIKTVTMGALLHDIGKLIQRANGIQNAHSGLLGAEFLAKSIAGYPGEVLDCIRFHHRNVLREGKLAEKHPAYIIFEANNIAIGRDERDEENASLYNPLASLFDRLASGYNGREGYSLQEMIETQPPNYPRSIGKLLVNADKYRNLVDTLKKNLQTKTYELQEPEFIQEVLEIVTSYVPSETGNEDTDDISFFDHSKMTAAVASCIAAYAQEKNWPDYRARLLDSEASEFRKEKVFLLVSGDLSGIQGFIYTIFSKGALKSLRARSFFLEILVENFIDDLLSACGLNRINLLFSGGSHFYALLPNTSGVERELVKTQEKVNEWFLQHFSTALYMGLAWQPCSAQDLMNPVDREGRRGNLCGELFRKVGMSLSEDKQRRYSEVQLERIFNPDAQLFEQQIGSRECTICHTSRPGLENWEDTYRCADCKSLMELGGKLTAGKIARIMSDKDGFPALVVERQGAGMELPPKTDIPRTLQLISSGEITDLDIERIYAIEKFPGGLGSASHIWLGNYCPNPVEGKVSIEFEDLAAASRGIKRLGVMRADVDNLGSIFTKGFEQKDSNDPYRFTTISRYAVLSRQLSLFFRHHINYIAEKGPGDDIEGFALNRDHGLVWKGKDGQAQRQVIIIYAGGDDVFIVGAWDHVVEFAVDLRQAFRRFNGNTLTFSAGIGFFTDHTPMSFMAKAVGELEEIAKKLPGKDGIALFGIPDMKTGEEHVYNWDVFIDKVCNEKLASLLRWFDWNGGDEVPSPGKLAGGDSLAHRLLYLLRGCGWKDSKINIARLAYLLGRLESGIKKDDQAGQQTYKNIREGLWEWINQANDRHQLLTALNLLIYLKRIEQKKEERV